MTERVEKFRQLLQKELGLSVGPKDPILAEFLAQQELQQEMAAEHQRLLAAFEVALRKSEALWAERAKNLANQSLNAALGAARDHIAALGEQSARTNAGTVRAAVQEGVERLEQALAVSRRLAWVNLSASIVVFLAVVCAIVVHVIH